MCARPTRVCTSLAPTECERSEAQGAVRQVQQTRALRHPSVSAFSALPVFRQQNVKFSCDARHDSSFVRRACEVASSCTSTSKDCSACWMRIVTCLAADSRSSALVHSCSLLPAELLLDGHAVHSLHRAAFEACAAVPPLPLRHSSLLILVSPGVPLSLFDYTTIGFGLGINLWCCTVIG